MKTKVYKSKETVRKIAFAAMCIALAMVLPFLTGAIPEIGGALCPMHIPALLSGVLCGPFLGALVSFVSPLLRGLAFGSPAIFPRGVSMAVELFAYALVFGLLKKLLPKKIGYTYVALGIAMICGRLVGGISKLLLLAFGAIEGYGWKLFFAGYFVETVPGVIVQILLIPPILYALGRAKLVEE